MNSAPYLPSTWAKKSLAVSDQFKFQDPQHLVMVTKELKEAQKARMGESKFLNQIKSFNYCLLKHVESVEKTGISLETIQTENAINTWRLGKIFEMRNIQWIEPPPRFYNGAVTRHPKPNKKDEE